MCARNNNNNTKGRIDELLYVGYPTKQEQIDICKVISRRMAINCDDVDFEQLMDELEKFTSYHKSDDDDKRRGLSGSDLEILFRYFFWGAFLYLQINKLIKYFL